MNVKRFTLRENNDSVEFSNLLNLYNKMAKYCNPTAYEINEEFASVIFNTNPDLWNNTIIFENPQNKIIGFASIMKLPFYKDEWFVIYGIEPEYFESKLPETLIEEILKIGTARDFQELYFQTSGTVSEPFDQKLRTLGFDPIHYYFFMSKEDSNILKSPEMPEGFSITGTSNIEDYKSIVSVINEAFKDSFMWNELKVRKWRKMMETININREYEYGIVNNGEKCIAFCNSYIDLNEKDKGFINTLAVIPDYQGRGIGSALFISRVNFLIKKGCMKINLPVDAKNEGALQLYEKYGFHKIKDLTERTYRLL